MERREIAICGGYYCGSNWDAARMRQALREELSRAGLQDEIDVPDILGGCFGLCLRGPNMIIEPDGVWYSKVTTEDFPEIIERHLNGGEVIKRLQDPMHPIWKMKHGQM